MHPSGVPYSIIPPCSAKGQQRFVECSFRDSHILSCSIGALSFHASSVEAAEMRECKVGQLDISFTSCTGLLLDENDMDKIIFSTPAFFLVVGGWGLLDAKAPILRDTVDGETVADITGRSEIRAVLAEQLTRQMELHSSIWRIASGMISLGYDQHTPQASLSTVVPRLIEEVRNSELSEEQLLDELVLTLKLFVLVDLLDEAFAAFMEEVLNDFTGISQTIHPDVWNEFSALVSGYVLATRRSYTITFKFANLNARDPDQVRAAAGIASLLAQLVSTGEGSEQLRISEGSVILDILPALKDVPWWIAVAIAIGLGSKVNINFDINQMLTQVGTALSFLRRDRQQQLNEAKEATKQHQIVLVVSDQYLERSAQAVPINLLDQLEILDAPEGQGIRLAVHSPGAENPQTATRHLSLEKELLGRRRP